MYFVYLNYSHHSMCTCEIWSSECFYYYVMICSDCWIISNCLFTAVVNCGTPPAPPANGQRRGSGITFRSTVTYSCNTGYTLTGSNRRTCMASGQWNGSTPNCTGELLSNLMHIVLFVQCIEWPKQTSNNTAVQRIVASNQCWWRSI